MPDRPLGAGFLTVVFAPVRLAAAFFTGVIRAWAIGRDTRCGTIPCVVARRVTQDEQRPSRSALSSLAISSDPSSSVPQYVVVVKLLVRGTCHSAEALVTRLRTRSHSVTSGDRSTPSAVPFGERQISHAARGPPHLPCAATRMMSDLHEADLHERAYRTGPCVPENREYT